VAPGFVAAGGGPGETPVTGGEASAGASALPLATGGVGTDESAQASGNHTVFVTDNSTGAPISGARIEGPDGTLGITDPWGIATLSGPPDNVTVFKRGYDTRTAANLSGRHTQIGLDPAVQVGAFHDLHVLLYNQKTQAAVGNQYAVTMEKLELGGTTYDVPADLAEYEDFVASVEGYAETDPNGEWAGSAVRLLNGETVVRATAAPQLPPAASLGDDTPSDELLLPEGTYSVQSTTDQFEDTGEQLRLDRTVMLNVNLEPHTGELQFTLDPETTTDAGGASADAGTSAGGDWDIEEFSVEIVARDDGGSVIKRDSFAPGRELTHHGDLTVDGNQVTISDYPTGEYDVRIESQGFETVTVDEVEVPDDGTAALGEIALPANGTTLEVEVVSSLYVDGQGESMELEGAPVRIEGATGAAAGYTDTRETPANGTVTFSGVPNGQYDVTVGATEITADGVTARFRPQSLVMNLGAEALTGGSPDPEEPDLGEWRVGTAEDHKLIANLQPTTGHVEGTVVGNGSAELWPVVTWPNDDSEFAEEFRQHPVDGASVEFEAEFDGHELNPATDLIGDGDLSWETTPLGVVYGDLPPGEYDLTLAKEPDEEDPVGFTERTVEDVAVDSAERTILSPEPDPDSRADAEPFELERDGDYVFGQVRMDVFSGNAGVVRSTDHWGADAVYPPSFFTPAGGPGYYGPIADATIEFSSGNRTVTLQTNQSGQFDAGYLQGGDWDIAVSNTPYELADASYELALNGDGGLVGIIVVVQSASGELDASHDCEGLETCVPGLLSITNGHNGRSILLPEPTTTQLPTRRSYDLHHDDKHDEGDVHPWFVHAGVAGPYNIDVEDDETAVETDERAAEIEGYVYNEKTWEPLEGASVTVDGESLGPTDENGYYSGTVKATMPTDTVVDVDVVVSHETVTETTFRKVELTPGGNRFDPYVEPDAGELRGVVLDADNETVEGVRVVYEGEKTPAKGGTTTYTDEAGEFSFNLQAGAETDARFTFEHPELFPAEGTFDIDIPEGGVEEIPASGDIRINRTHSPSIVELEYTWAEPTDGVEKLPSETHVLSRMGAPDDLTLVNVTVRARRVPRNPTEPVFESVQPVYGEAGGFAGWLRAEDGIDDTEPGNVTYDHTASEWRIEPPLSREGSAGEVVTLTTSFDLAHVPVTRADGSEFPVTVNTSVTTARGATGWRNRTLADGGTDGTNLYLNAPPRPLDAMIGDRAAEVAAFELFSSTQDAVSINGSELGGAYPEIAPDTSFEGTMERNVTDAGAAALVYGYELGMGLEFPLSEDLGDGSKLLDSFATTIPSEYSVSEGVTVENGAVTSSVKTDLGGTSESLTRLIESADWLSGVEFDNVTYTLGYRSTDEYGLAPSDRGLRPEWDVEGDVGIGLSADVLDLIPQLKPLSAAGASAELGSEGTLGAEVSGERDDGGDAYFGPVDDVDLGPEATASFTLGLEPGVGPLAVSVAEGKATATGALGLKFRESLKPTAIFLNGSVGASVDSLAYSDSWDIAGPGTITKWDLASESTTTVYHIEREQGVDLRYRQGANYHTVRGATRGTLVEAAYPEGVPQPLRRAAVYIHDDPGGTYPGSLRARVLDRGDNESVRLDVGGPPLALATDGGDAMATSHLPEREAYGVHPLSYLHDAGISLVDREGGDWSNPVEISPAGGGTMDLYPALASSEDSYYVAWRRDRGLSPNAVQESALAVRTVDREDGTLSGPTVLESNGVVAPADVAAGGGEVTVLGMKASAGGPTLTAYRKQGDGWEESTVASRPGIGPDTAAVAIDPETGQATYAWSDGRSIRVESAAGTIETIEADGRVSNLDLVAGDGEPVLVWEEFDGQSTVHATVPGNDSVTPEQIEETPASTRVSGMAAAAGPAGTGLVYGVSTIENGTEVDSAGVDVVYAEVRSADGPPIVVGDSPPRDPDGDGLYGDINGDGAFTIQDVQLFFQHREGEAVQNNPQFFNFDRVDPPAVTIRDVQALFLDFLES